jgi:chromate reductase
MTEVSEPIRAIGFAGSLRRGSYNRALLRAAVELAPEEMNLDVFDLAPVPLYDADVEATGDPEPVAALKAAIRAADLLVIATPEYNQGIPAVTKNAVDWASRPPRPHVLDGKPVAILGATPARLGTVSAQRALRESLSALSAFVMPQPRMLIAGASKLFDDDGNLVDEDTRARLERFMSAAAAWGARFRADGY